MDNQLKPCPFCGSEAQMTTGFGAFSGRVQIDCANCRNATWWWEEAVAVRSWNARVALAPSDAPQATNEAMPQALWTRHGSGSLEWWSFKGYEARKDSADQWVLRKAGEELYRHTYLQVVMAHAERAILDAAPHRGPDD
ncbi:hypothetical protein SB783_18270 [Paraburkholderia sp. SIMBA_009]